MKVTGKFYIPEDNLGVVLCEFLYHYEGKIYLAGLQYRPFLQNFI